MVSRLRLVTRSRHQPGDPPLTIALKLMSPVSPVRLVPILAGLLLSIVAASAQMSVDPIEFSYDYPRIGGEIGLAPAWQSGEYVAGCGTFTEGGSINPIIAIAYDRPLIDRMLRFEVLGGWFSRGVSSAYNEREAVVVQTTEGPAALDVDFEHSADLSASYVFLMPSAKFYILESVYAGAGASANILVGASSQYTKTIVSKSRLVPALGTVAEISYPEDESDDPYAKIFPSEDRPDMTGFGLDIVAYVGAEFKLGERMKLGPRLSLALPLTNVIDEPALKLMSMQMTIGLRYALFR